MGVYVVSSKYNGGSEVLHPHSGNIIEQLDSPESVAQSILTAVKYRKTPKRAQQIRGSVMHLDLQKQFSVMVQATLEGL
ncbi:hypothetical protein SCG7086_AO_00080 [Chlamydiales bacterium SCGC AG-110-P3]|nr:hypothetical protein SCG7086_AO_00080 [Chlamydiales bacterium SCGC AG-110-P3]